MGRGATTTPTAPAGAAPRRPQPAAEDAFAGQRAEVGALLRYDPDLFQANVALISLIGSQAYGMANEGSDSDYRGVYIADIEQLLSLEKPQPQFDRRDPDITVFEVGKFCKLAMAANPNVLEVLWGPKLHVTPLGQRLRQKRHLFLSQHARTSYADFAISQLKRIERHDREGRQDKREKSARHLFRLFEQAEQILRHGDLELRVSDPEEIRRLSKLPMEEIREYFDLLDDWLRHMPSDLPDRADFAAVSELVRELRMAGTEARPPSQS